MNVHDASGPHRAESLRRLATNPARPDGAATPETAAGAEISAADRVELSPEARSASAGQTELEREVAFARRAMYSLPPLDAERAEALVEQLRQGHYDAPDVLLKLSRALTNEIAPRT